MRSNNNQESQISGRTLYDSSGIEELLPRWNCVYTKGRVVFILLRVRIPLVAAGTLKP